MDEKLISNIRIVLKNSILILIHVHILGMELMVQKLSGEIELIAIHHLEKQTEKTAKDRPHLLEKLLKRIKKERQ